MFGALAAAIELEAQTAVIVVVVTRDVGLVSFGRAVAVTFGWQCHRRR